MSDIEIPGFDPANALEMKVAFYDFISHISIDSKETGTGRIRPYFAQRLFIDGVFDGLEKDIHWTVVLKARQLGITTFSVLLDLFWLSYFPGIQGGLVTDTDPNKEKLRLLITRMLESLPESHKIPIVTHNKNGLVLANGSSLDYLSAGTKRNSNLGRSRAFNYLHATECSSWGDTEGVQSLQKTLAEHFPARLYIWESTAKGFNLFYDLWEDARNDDLAKTALFIGWWAKESYQLKEGTPLYERYSAQPPNDEEAELIAIVKDKYDFDVTMEQLAWYRYQDDPARTSGGDERSEDSIIEQEFPWHEDQAFMVTGSHFFPGHDIGEATKVALKENFYGYRYFLGETFLSARIEPVRNEKQAQLKIWEEPQEGAVYVIGADPAYGASEKSDRHALQVLRCYSDGIDQVAEFTTNQMYAYQFAWVIAHIAGLYQNARYLLELNGPGEAVFTEFKNLRQSMMNGELREGAQEKGIRYVLSNVRTYMYARSDSMESRASAWHWKTSMTNKMPMMNQLRDTWLQKQLFVRSVQCLKEMQGIVQEGIEIAAEGNGKDDRVMALALATRAWMDGERATLRAQGRTRAVELGKAVPPDPGDLAKIFNQNIIADTLAMNSQILAARRRAARPRRWNW